MEKPNSKNFYARTAQLRFLDLTIALLKNAKGRSDFEKLTRREHLESLAEQATEEILPRSRGNVDREPCLQFCRVQFPHVISLATERMQRPDI